jgi:pimeloyl-ACP methyl ester carboxylesterase
VGRISREDCAEEVGVLISHLAFDYRCFGGSEGTPRNRIAPARHEENYGAARDFPRRALDVVDVSRTALWGSSFAGAIALVVCSRRECVSGRLAVPLLKALPHIEPWGLARYVALASLDRLRTSPPFTFRSSVVRDERLLYDRQRLHWRAMKCQLGGFTNIRAPGSMSDTWR